MPMILDPTAYIVNFFFLHTCLPETQKKKKKTPKLSNKNPLSPRKEACLMHPALANEFSKFLPA
ncbi:hypothetical protein I7I53_06405 [Histoplasma capsulatum var. duboisii H88]|uniref:Uncharacterized protein n=1 Tax=Ajellomyces capsulatus (strain H88) TaxID=544711 RepID=A0A8A1LB27_AJEC8|nr:hypothetical protein I7I53_06405 [Histoplasma capsulatum var. duboisii H88]